MYYFTEISGERIWAELKKILSGNFAKEIMLRMLDLGMGPHIGIIITFLPFIFESNFG